MGSMPPMRRDIPSSTRWGPRTMPRLSRSPAASRTGPPRSWNGGAWVRTPIRKKPIRWRAINRCWLRSTALRCWAGSPRARMRADGSRSRGISSRTAIPRHSPAPDRPPWPASASMPTSPSGPRTGTGWKGSAVIPGAGRWRPNDCPVLPDGLPVPAPLGQRRHADYFGPAGIHRKTRRARAPAPVSPGPLQRRPGAGGEVAIANCSRRAGPRPGRLRARAGRRTLQPRAHPRPRNYSRAQLMRRVFAIDVLECPGCGGRLRILAAIQSPEAIHKILDHLGLPARAPPIRPAAYHDEGELEWA